MKILLSIFFILLLQARGLASMARIPDHIKYHSNEEIPEEYRKQLGRLDYGFKQFSIDGIRAEFDSEKKIYTEAYVTIALPPEELYQEFISFTVSMVRGNWHLRQPPRGSHSLKMSGKEKMFSERFLFNHRALKPAEIVEIIHVLWKKIENPPEGANFSSKDAGRFFSMPIACVSLRNKSIRVELRHPEEDDQRRIFFSLKELNGDYVLDPLYGITIYSK